MIFRDVHTLNSEILTLRLVLMLVYSVNGYEVAQSLALC